MLCSHSDGQNQLCPQRRRIVTKKLYALTNVGFQEAAPQHLDHLLNVHSGPRLCENTQIWYASCGMGVHICQVSSKVLTAIR